MIEESEERQTAEEIQREWISGHLYHHQNLDAVVRGFVHPLVVALVKAEHIDAFFFVRYALGGPHIRLRLHALRGSEAHVLETMQLSAQRFLDSEPSTRSLAEEAIQRSNQHILAADPHEIDDLVYPDNLFRLVAFRPEVERYGGSTLFRTSLQCFTLSSVAALEFLARHRSAPRSAQLAHAFRLLLGQALGFAADAAELLDLLRYGVDSWGGLLPRVVEKGDKVAGSQMESFLRLFGDSVVRARSLRLGIETSTVPAEFLAAGAGKLSEATETGDRSARARIGGSQLHMTASRLGLSNAEEVYISRLLTLTFRGAHAGGRGDLSWLGERVVEEREDPLDSLGALLSAALAALTKMPDNPSGSARRRLEDLSGR